MGPVLRHRTGVCNNDPDVYAKTGIAVDHPFVSANEETTLEKRERGSGEDDAKEDGTSEESKNQVVFGKTPDGKVFPVPQTADMLTAVFEPTARKSAFDKLTIAVMIFQITLFFVIPSSLKRWVFLALFVCWRTSYNLGLGMLLKYQSNRRGLVLEAKRRKIFDGEKGGRWHAFLKAELSAKMGPDYDFEQVPLEFNTWLLFRALVDMILLNDFVSFVCFALANFHIPDHSGIIVNVLRWAGGLFLLVFNIWVKADAHRVVKDFAWYWGDFFFLIEQSLTFDGVFEMAPHPMYSVGYVGLYGISLMMASYTVMFVSLAAHAAQFAFLMFVENPHIDKTYNPPKSLNDRLAPMLIATVDQDRGDANALGSFSAASNVQGAVPDLLNAWQCCFRRDLVIFKNFDYLRSADLFVAFVVFYAVFTPLFLAGASDSTIKIFVVAQCLFWRIFHTYGLGAVLFFQSKDKLLTKHYIKFGGSVAEAFQNWKSIYNLSLCMTYVTFLVAAWKMYSLPDEWTYGMVLLRHTVGVLLIALHVWTSVSVFEVLSEFGWFYGDFFLDDFPATLYYTGIYRFVNNPEKLMGHAAFWGITLIANSWLIFGLALFSQISNFLFLRYVESPHMKKLYGDKIRKEAGVIRTLKRVTVIPGVLKQEMSKFREALEIQRVERVIREVAETIEKIVEEATETVGELVESAKPRLQEVVLEARTLLNKLIASQVRIDTERHDLAQYSIELIPTTKSEPDDAMLLTPPDSPGTVAANGRPKGSEPITYTLGTPIRLNWVAPISHARKDWIGVYKVTANSSKAVSSVSSRGRYYYVTPDEEELELDGVKPSARIDVASGIEYGEMCFKGDKLPWEVGTYEFRYHHDDRHSVVAISQPFEITVQSAASSPAIEQTLLTLVQKALDSDPELIPQTTADDYVLMKEVHAKRIVYGIRMIFGIDFAWKVVAVDRNVRTLAKRINDARRALAPFRTPTE